MGFLKLVVVIHSVIHLLLKTWVEELVVDGGVLVVVVVEVVEVVAKVVQLLLGDVVRADTPESRHRKQDIRISYILFIGISVH